MQWGRPKSLSGLMLVGIGLMAVPLLTAVLTAVLQMRVLADTGHRIIVEGVTAARASQKLFAQIGALERTARLFNVLNEPKLLDVYRVEDEQLTATRDQLRRHANESARRTLDELGELQAGTRFVVLSTAASSSANTAAALSARFSELSKLVEQVAQQGNDEIDTEVAALEAQTLRARQELLWESALLVPLALLALLVLTLGVGRPLRQLDRAISELGQGNFTNTIAVPGPHDLETLGRQLEWLRQRLLELAHERNRFLRHMSHELKTPLANIREGTELLMDGAVGELDSNQREVAAILRENGIKLQRMIENLLSFSAWQTSSVGLETSEFRLRPLVKQVLENQQLTLLSQRVRLDVRVEDIVLVADRGKIRLILENLVSNAVKYSPKGGTIFLRGRATSGQLVLDVADSGAGIPLEDRRNIFEAFYTGRAARSTAVKGTGIGLSVVLEFVSAHKGTVEIVDGEFPGAHFRITMPIRTTSGDRPAASETRDKAHAHAA
jgi:two-component system, NtrC family, sensor histidine kinase GlrK